MADVLKNLAAFEWRNEQYPTLSFSTTIAHDLVEHKYWGRDGADVEAVGRAPLRVRVRIPFFNNIFPGRGERWKHGSLYPIAFRKFSEDFANRVTGIIIHPEYGWIPSKPSSMSCEWSGQSNRDGVFVDAEWVETFDEEGKAQSLKAPSADLDLKSASASFEAQKRDIASLLPPGHDDDFWATVLTMDFVDLANLATSASGTLGAVAYSVAGKLTSIEYHAERVMKSLDVINSPLVWPARDACTRMIEAAQKARENQLRQDRKVLTMRLERTMTLASVVAIIPSARVGDIIRLNPKLISSPIVVRDSEIRYYAA
jgi:hypothetical protein